MLRSRRRFLPDGIDADEPLAGVPFVACIVLEHVAVTLAIGPAGICLGHRLRIFGQDLVGSVAIGPVGAPQRDDADPAGIPWAMERVAVPDPIDRAGMVVEEQRDREPAFRVLAFPGGDSVRRAPHSPPDGSIQRRCRTTMRTASSPAKGCSTSGSW